MCQLDYFWLPLPLPLSSLMTARIEPGDCPDLPLPAPLEWLDRMRWASMAGSHRRADWTGLDYKSVIPAHVPDDCDSQMQGLLVHSTGDRGTTRDGVT